MSLDKEIELVKLQVCTTYFKPVLDLFFWRKYEYGVKLIPKDPSFKLVDSVKIKLSKV